MRSAALGEGYQRNAKREGLARTGGSRTTHISTGQRVGDGGGLDFKGTLDAAARKRVADKLGHTKISKSRGGNSLRGQRH